MHNGRTCRIAKELVKKLPRAAQSIAGSECERGVYSFMEMFYDCCLDSSISYDVMEEEKAF